MWGFFLGGWELCAMLGIFLGLGEMVFVHISFFAAKVHHTLYTPLLHGIMIADHSTNHMLQRVAALA
jgi:hypothetical protein